MEEMFSNFQQVLTILSAMITPAVLILATSSLILATSQRLARILERTRKINEDFDRYELGLECSINSDAEKFMMAEQMRYTSKRARYLQQSLSVLYLGLSVFLATTISIGFFDIFDVKFIWVTAALFVSGTILLFYATILLIIETVFAFLAVKKETTYMRGVANKYLNQRTSQAYQKR